MISTAQMRKSVMGQMKKVAWEYTGNLWLRQGTEPRPWVPVGCPVQDGWLTDHLFFRGFEILNFGGFNNEVGFFFICLVTTFHYTHTSALWRHLILLLFCFGLKNNITEHKTEFTPHSLVSSPTNITNSPYCSVLNILSLALSVVSFVHPVLMTVASSKPTSDI